MRGKAPPTFGATGGGGLAVGLLASGRSLIGGALGRYAGSLAFVLCACNRPSNACRVLGAVLAQSNDPTWPYKSETPIWQRDFFDRRLRSGESYRQKWLYLWENSIKEGIVSRAEDWPYQREMNALAWHDPTIG